MTPLHPIRFGRTALLQLETMKDNPTEQQKIFKEAHNYLCRLPRPYESSYPDGVILDHLKKDYFTYKRKPFNVGCYGFYFLSPADGYIYIDKITIYTGSNWEELPTA